MKAITLKSRVIILLSIFTIFTIGIFITIQLSHEVEAVGKYIVINAKEYSRQIEEEILSSQLSAKEKINFLEKLLRSLKEQRIIERAYVFDTTGKILSSTEASLSQDTAEYADLQILDKIEHGERVRDEVTVDKPAKLISMYIPIKEKESALLIVKVFFPLGDIWTAFGQVYYPALTVGFLIIFVNIALGIFLARLIIGPIKVFNIAAKRVASGQLDLKVKVLTNDELEELADTFNFMTVELVKMKERAENANPLTKLPGNLVIAEEVGKRIKLNEKFVVIYGDLDNFKAFNDKYGIHKGDEAIQLTAQILREALKHKGDCTDFLGHEGGDDFIVLTTPERAQQIADYIIFEFNKQARSLYSQEDLDRGYIVSTARDGTVKEFAIMTISLAGATNVHRQINNYAEVTNIAAEMKKKAKKEARSCFVIDQRKE